MLEITRLRAERAALLGFPSHAAAVTADQTARTPEAVADMLGRLAPAAARNARAEAVELQRVIDRTQEERGEPTFELAAWDWAFYSERVRTERYDVDTERMRPYLEADRVLRDGVFRAATALYGVTFTGATTSSPTTPTRASSRCATRTDPPSACTSSTSTPVTPSAAGRG